MKIVPIMIVALFVGQGVASEKSTHPWAKWKPGSFVKYSSDKDTVVIDTLKEVKGNIVTVMSEMTLMGRKLSAVPIQESISESCAHCSPSAVKSGPEMVNVGGKDYSCSVYTVSSSSGKRILKVWIADGVELPIKTYEMTPEPLKGELTMVAVNLSEDIKVGGRTVTCVKYEGKGMAPGGAKTSILWRSVDVPGGLVKQIITIPGQTSVQEVIDFNGKR